MAREAFDGHRLSATKLAVVLNRSDSRAASARPMSKPPWAAPSTSRSCPMVDWWWPRTTRACRSSRRAPTRPSRRASSAMADSLGGAPAGAPGCRVALTRLVTRSIGPRPIGVFDSGVGGLTVLSEIASAPAERATVYLGDNERTRTGRDRRMRSGRSPGVRRLAPAAGRQGARPGLQHGHLACPR